MDTEASRRATARPSLPREYRERGRRLVDARVLASRLGVEHQWVVDHARELGGVRLGATPGRLRFDVAAAEQHLSCPYAQTRKIARDDANGPSRWRKREDL